ncbi:hypothetical protein AYO37_01135 [Opitutia bacterium SCGC AG-212-L18]|nr:hypothetical protein AYO37_01135 [Opitutae bacterium SCGC AG-212-L18]
MAYRWVGNKEGSKKLEKNNLAKRLVKIIGAEDLASEKQKQLFDFIKKTKTFKGLGLNAVDKLTEEKIKDIRLEVQLNSDFIRKATKEELRDFLETVSDQEGYVKEKVQALGRLAKIYTFQDSRECYEEVMRLGGIEIWSKYRIFGDDIFNEYEMFNELAYLYNQMDDVDNVIKCYEMALHSKGITTNEKYFVLAYLGDIYEKQGDSDKAVIYYEALNLEGIGLSKKYEMLIRLASVYEKQGNIEDAINCYEKILSLKGLSYAEKHYPLTKLGMFYGKESNFDEAYAKIYHFLEVDTQHPEHESNIEYYFLDGLALSYRNQGKLDECVKCYEIMLSLPMSEKSHVLERLGDIYESQGDFEQAFACYEMMDLNLFDNDSVFSILNKIIAICKRSGNLTKAIQCYQKILKLDQELFDQLLEEKSEEQVLKIFEALDRCSDLWRGQNQLTSSDWRRVIDAENPGAELIQLYQDYISVSNPLNKDLILNDPTMPKWNVLLQREGEIDDTVWNTINDTAHIIFDAVYPDKKAQRKYVAWFLNKCMNTAVAKGSEEGARSIRKRVTACMDYLYDLKLKYDQTHDEVEKERIKKQIQGGLDLITIGGTECPDRAIVFLTDLENYIKLLKNPKYLPNVMVQMFKFEAIQQALIDPLAFDEGQGENIESFLAYCAEQNLVLGLGLVAKKNETMLHEDIAKTEPLKDALPKLSKIFNEEKLLNFTANQNAFKLALEKEKEAVLEDLQQQYSEADDEAQDAANDLLDANHEASVAEKAGAPNAMELRAKATGLNEKAVDLREKSAALAKDLEDTERNFYKNKARELFVKAGFIVEANLR